MAPQTMYWVVRHQFHPYLDGWADYDFAQGAILITGGNLYNEVRPKVYSPMSVMTPDGKSLNMQSTFRVDQPQFLDRVWGPYDGEVIKNLWIFNGVIGPEKRDFHLSRAGSLQVARLDDIQRRNVICSANFKAIMGNALLKRDTSGSFSIAEPFNLSSIIEEAQSA